MTSYQDVGENNFNHIMALVLKVAAFILVFSLASVSYNQGVTGDLFYDDKSFLGPLASLETLTDSAQFIKDGIGGPLGRPLALISFIPHAESWPESAVSARKINILIHLFNGLLLFSLAFQILLIRKEFQRGAVYWVALLATALWLVMPLLVSTSLITVQRWTGLSTLFGLIGLNIFTWAYFFQESRPRFVLILQGGGLAVFTLLSIYTKEIGALIPIYALVIDFLVKGHLKVNRPLVLARQVVLITGLFALLFYLSPLYQDWFTINAFRGWSSFERLQTQFLLLWHYLYIAFIPQIGLYGPFHDDIDLVTGWLPVLALLAFIILTTIAFLIRKKTPWPLFALLWFFTGHLIESTVIQLELMFEHRNYLAVYGLCLALAVLVCKVRGRLKKIAPVLLVLYTLIMWGALHATTTVWGSSMDAAENWVKHHPSSPRAVLHLSDVYHRELGNPSYSIHVLDRSMDQCTDCLDVRMQSFLYRCGSQNDEEMMALLEGILSRASSARASIALLDSFYPMQELLEDQACPPLTIQHAYQLTQKLLENPNYSAWQYQVHLLFHAAYFAKEQGDSRLALEYLAKAQSREPSVMPILMMQVHLLQLEGEDEMALELINQRRQVPNRNRYMSDDALDRLAESVKSQWQSVDS